MRANMSLYVSGKTFPCAARLVALRGYDGKELWRIRVPGAPFEMNCHKIDVDKDGKTDCIASGRMGTVVAFDPRKGDLICDVSTYWEWSVSLWDVVVALSYCRHHIVNREDEAKVHQPSLFIPLCYVAGRWISLDPKFSNTSVQIAT